MNAPRSSTPAQPAHLGWRLLALIYDSLPVLALWFAVSAVVLLLRGGAPLLPWTPSWWLQLVALWGVTGAYLVESWFRGGQTLGMRPWRLKVVADSGQRATRGQLWRRFVWATLSGLAAGTGFLASLLDSERRAWHDRVSATRLLRMQVER